MIEIYQTCFPQIVHHVRANSGNDSEAEDIFQDTLLLIYLKIRNNSLELSSSFPTYFFGVARFLWLRELERKRKFFGNTSEASGVIEEEPDFLEDYIKMERRKLVIEHFNMLNNDCQKILELYIKETPLYRITKLMGYSSDQYTKNRRSVCKERLIKAIWNNPRFKELKSDAHRKDSKVPRW